MKDTQDLPAHRLAAQVSMWSWEGRAREVEWGKRCREPHNLRCDSSEDKAAVKGLHCHLSPR